MVCWLLAATHDLYLTVKNQMGLIDCPPPTLLASFLKYSVLGWALPGALLAGAIFVQVSTTHEDNDFDLIFFQSISDSKNEGS